MKYLSTLIYGLVILVLGMAVVILGAIAKINHFEFSFFDGTFLLALGLMLNLVGIILISMSVIKNLRRQK